jgi:hypothetical protein
MQLATLRRVAALVLLVAAPAAIAQSVQHTTGTVTFRVFANGYFGNALGVPATGAFAFNGVNGLFEGQLVVGVGANQVAGQPYAAATAHEWTAAATPTAITPPSPFDQAFQGGPYTDGAPANPNPIGLSVLQRSYSSSLAPNNDFGIVELEITSTLAQPAVYVGIFADWDVGPTAILDLAGYDAANKLLYVFDNSAGNPNYYGVAVLGSTPVSGYSDDVGAGTNPTEPQVFLALTTTSPMATVPADRRTVIGTGPFNLAAGGTQVVRFAFVGGTNAADIIANAAAAQAIVFTAAEGGPNERGYGLAASPNPVSNSASISVTLPTVENARVAVYDVTGREVAVVLDEARAAGTHTIQWDASALPAGVYLVRLTAGSEIITRTISVAR